MQKLETLGQKIEALQKKKRELETKTALALFRKAQTTLGESFSADLALAILEDTWAQKTSQSLEVWQDRAKTFRRPSRSSKKASPSGQKHEQVAA